MHDLLSNGCSDWQPTIVQQFIVSPKFNLIYSPSGSLVLFFNIGTGFHSNDARVVLHEQKGTAPPRALGWEVGARYTSATSSTAGISLWLLDLEREFVYVGDEGRTEEGGATRRIDLDADVRFPLMRWLWLDFDMSLSRGRYTELSEGENHIPLAPTFTMTGGLTIRPSIGYEAALRLRSIDSRPANSNNTVWAQGYTVMDGLISLIRGSYSLSLMGENLLNTDWNEAQFDTESRLSHEPKPISELHFTPGSPRSFKILLSVRF